MQQELTAIKNFLQSLISSRAAGRRRSPRCRASSARRCRPPGARAGIRDRQGHDHGGLGLSLPVLQAADASNLPADRRRVTSRPARCSYMFVDYPIAQLHPPRAPRARGGELRRRAGQVLGDARAASSRQPPRKDDASLLTQAQGRSASTRRSCSRACRAARHAASVQASVQRMEQLGIAGTPMVLIGLDPRARPADEGREVRLRRAARTSDFKDAIRIVAAVGPGLLGSGAGSEHAQPAAAGQERHRGDLSLELRVPSGPGSTVAHSGQVPSGVRRYDWMK